MLLNGYLCITKLKCVAAFKLVLHRDLGATKYLHPIQLPGIANSCVANRHNLR